MTSMNIKIEQQNIHNAPIAAKFTKNILLLICTSRLNGYKSVLSLSLSPTHHTRTLINYIDKTGGILGTHLHFSVGAENTEKLLTQARKKTYCAFNANT